MLNIAQFRELIVKSTLNDLHMYSRDAEELLVFTCAVESLGGTYLHQVNGLALGIYQMQPLTYNDIWQKYIKINNPIFMKLLTNFNVAFMPSEERLIYDLRFATAMTRLFYARTSDPLPAYNDPDSIWEFYKIHYNTFYGSACRVSSMKKYHDFIYS